MLDMLYIKSIHLIYSSNYISNHYIQTMYYQSNQCKVYYINHKFWLYYYQISVIHKVSKLNYHLKQHCNCIRGKSYYCYSISNIEYSYCKFAFLNYHNKIQSKQYIYIFMLYSIFYKRLLNCKEYNLQCLFLNKLYSYLSTSLVSFYSLIFLI